MFDIFEVTVVLDIIVKGFLIGILVSAPMGPIGLLCVQRTLKRGWRHGFFTGIGAAFSDVFYAGITCLGMGFVINFIEVNQFVLKIAGSVMLLIFGVYVFRSNPFAKAHDSKDSDYSYSQNAATAFLLALSNPLIILLYIIFLARFNFISAGETMASILLGLLSILFGALSWWLLITFLVDKLRKAMKLRSLLIMNRVIGIFVVVLSVFLLLSLLLSPK